MWEKGHFRDNCPNKTTPKKRGKSKILTSIKTWDDSSTEDEAPLRSHNSHHSSNTHLINALWHKVTLMIHPLVSMIVIVIVMMKTLNKRITHVVQPFFLKMRKQKA
jgi:hypothetical protein